MSSVVSFSFSRTRHLYGLIMITIKFLGKKGKLLVERLEEVFVYLFIFVFLVQVFSFFFLFFLLRTNQKLNKKYITL